MLRNYPTTAYTFLAFAISWSIYAFGKWGLGLHPGLAWTLMAAIFMLGPALATVLLRRPSGVSWAQLGIIRNGIRWNWMGIAVLLAVLLPPLTLLFNWLLGDVLHIAAFGHTEVSKAMMLNLVKSKVQEAGMPTEGAHSSMARLEAAPLNGAALLLIMLAAGAVAGCTINFAFAMGEELGWRGMLFHHTRAWGLWGQIAFTGVVWGLWHAPLIMEGHNYPDHPVAGVFFMCLFTTAMAIPLAWVRVRSGCVWAAGVFHGTVNGVAGSSMVFNTSSSSMAGGAAGISAVLALVTIGALLFLFDPSFRKNFAGG